MADLPALAAPAMTLEPELTVCICTRDRPRSLAAALASITELAPRARIVVSDDGDSPARSLAEETPGCRWQPGPRRGLGANRNAVVAAAETEWVLFLDDDARLGAGFVDAVGACRDALPPSARERTVITGRERNRGRLVDPHDVDFLGFQRRSYGRGEEVRTVVINAAVWPRRLFDEVRFDERLRYGSDEVDVSYSALAAGYSIVSCPGAVNLHEPDPGGRESYAESAHASRLRATTKRYWRLRRKPALTAAFLGLAPLHLVLSQLKRDGARGLASSLRILRSWLTA